MSFKLIDSAQLPQNTQLVWEQKVYLQNGQNFQIAKEIIGMRERLIYGISALCLTIFSGFSLLFLSTSVRNFWEKALIGNVKHYVKLDDTPEAGRKTMKATENVFTSQQTNAGISSQQGNRRLVVQPKPASSIPQSQPVVVASTPNQFSGDRTSIDPSVPLFAGISQTPSSVSSDLQSLQPQPKKLQVVIEKLDSSEQSDFLKRLKVGCRIMLDLTHSCSAKVELAETLYGFMKYESYVLKISGATYNLGSGNEPFIIQKLADGSYKLTMDQKAKKLRVENGTLIECTQTDFSPSNFSNRIYELNGIPLLDLTQCQKVGYYGSPFDVSSYQLTIEDVILPINVKSFIKGLEKVLIEDRTNHLNEYVITAQYTDRIERMAVRFS